MKNIISFKDLINNFKTNNYNMSSIGLLFLHLFSLFPIISFITVLLYAWINGGGTALGMVFFIHGFTTIIGSVFLISLVSITNLVLNYSNKQTNNTRFLINILIAIIVSMLLYYNYSRLVFFYNFKIYYTTWFNYFNTWIYL